MSVSDVEATVAGFRKDRAEATAYRVAKVALVSLHGGCTEVFDHWSVLGGGGESDACL